MVRKAMALVAGAAMLSFASTAEAGVITGKVIDSSTDEPMEFVNVTVSNKHSGMELPVGTMSGADGSFKLHDVPSGTYEVKFSYVGYRAALLDAVLSSSNESLDLNVVELSENAHVLDEVEVIGMKSQMRFELDKKVFDVSQNVAAAGASASEILETIPSVEVDEDGEVSLRGNSSVTVWINGRPSGLTADNRGQILEQLPAETIEKVEIITNPSAKYSPEGTSGIINIVLKQNRQPGYFGGAQVGANTQGGYNAGGNINFNVGKWDAYANVGLRSWHNEGYNNSYRTYADDTYLNSLAETERRNTSVFFRAGATYNLTEADAISLGGFGMVGGGWNRNRTTYDSSVPGSFTSGYSNSDSDNNGRGGNVSLDYTHEFSETHELMASVSYNLWRMPSSVDYSRRYDYPDSTDAYVQHQESNIKVNNWEFQIDYSNQIGERFKIESGYKGTLSHEDSPMMTWTGLTEENMPIDEELYNRFIYDQNIQAVYATFGGKIDNFSFSAGLRGEYWRNEVKSLAYGESESAVSPYVTHKFALFPSLFLSYSLPKDNELQVNYTRRIRRPWGGQLNPFVNISDPTNISYGNPELQPQYANSCELNYIKNWTDHVVSVSGYYRSTGDVIQRISFMRDGVMNSTNENVSNSLEAGGEFVVKNSFFKRRLDLTTTVNLYYNRLDGFSFLPEGLLAPVVGEEESDFTWNFNLMASVRLPWDISLQLSGRYYSRQIVAQGSRDPRYRIDGGLKKSLDNWSFSVNVRDLLDSRKWNQMTYGSDFVQETDRRGMGRQVRFSVSYSFGNAKARKPDRRNGYGGEAGGMGGYEMD